MRLALFNCANWHGTEKRVEAHVLVSFLDDCL